MKLNVQKLHEDAILPKAAHESDAAVDLHSIEDYELQPGERKLFKSVLTTRRWSRVSMMQSEE